MLVTDLIQINVWDEDPGHAPIHLEIIPGAVRREDLVGFIRELLSEAGLPYEEPEYREHSPVLVVANRNADREWESDEDEWEEHDRFLKSVVAVLSGKTFSGYRVSVLCES